MPSEKQLKYWAYLKLNPPKQCFKKGQKFPYRPKPYQKTKEFIERLKKQGFQNGNKPWHAGTNGIIKQGFKSGEKHLGWKGGLTYKYKIKNATRPIPKLCEVCNRDGRICYDHDHKTGKFRGWLCHKCNAALGMVNDSQEILLKLVNYLK